MNEKNKESKFLDAINRYAENQKTIINSEVEEYKAQKIEQATESGLKDAYELIRRDIARRKAAIVTEYAKKDYELRTSLFTKRTEITDEVFKKAYDKLYEFAASEEYADFLKSSLEEASRILVDERCTVYIRDKDLSFKKLISEQLAVSEIKTDKSIKLGGIKVICETKGIELDDTLDTRLSDQRGWFIENSGLKVV